MSPGLARAAYFLPSLAVALAIFLSSSISHFGRIEETDLFDQDKLAHVLVYGLLSVSILWGLNAGFARRPAPLSCLLALALATLYGLGDEFHQMFVPRRCASWKDVLADAAGALLGIALVLLTARLRTRRQADPAAEN